MSLSSKLEQNKDKCKEFWSEKLSEIENVDLRFLKLESDTLLSEIDNTVGQIRFSFRESELSKLKQIKEHVVTPYVYSLCIFAMLLHRYTGQNKFVIVYPLAIKEGVDFIYGAQLNTSFVPYQFDKIATIKDLFDQTTGFFKTLRQSRVNYSYYPLANIISDGNKHLMDICFIQTSLRDTQFILEGITRAEILTELYVDAVNKDTLLFEQELIDNSLNFRVRFNQQFINHELLENFILIYKKLFTEILNDLANGCDRAIADYKLLNQEQYQRLVYELNRTEKDYPKDKTIQNLFEEQVTKTPNNIAVVCGTAKLTYRELNQNANQLAHLLRSSYDIAPDDLIVLCLDSNEQMMVSLFGVLKSGGAYVPVDPSYPDERISHILRDTQTKVILTNSIYQTKLEKLKGKPKTAEVISVDAPTIQTKLALQNSINPITKTTATNLVYAIFTSGTTGKPKGILVEHRSVINYVMYLINEAKLNEKSIGSKYAAFGFDASVTEIYPILLSGGTLHIISKQDRLDPIRINNFFKQNAVTYAFLPTKIAELFFKFESSSLINLVVGGEKLEKFNKRNYKVINAYGPAETTVQPTCFIVDRSYTNIPIGKSISNVKCYVVDNNMNILPFGAIGELLVGGDCLAQGYLKLPDITRERFISNSFQTDEEKALNKNNKLYKTGDLVRMLPDGNMEYIGRNDFQVKINGRRVELGEIESTLLNYPGIKQAVVLLKENKEKAYLIAYYTSDKKVNVSDPKSYLVNKLPSYMLPNICMEVDDLPLTINGKVDRRKLPEPIFTRNEIEKNP